ncbi:MAG: tetratricopeptide repeat protein [Myxococcaceae bacterium]
MAVIPGTGGDDAFLTLLYRGGELLQAGQLEDARSQLEAAYQLQPDNEKGQNLLGLAYFKLGHFDRAAEIYEGLVRENASDPTLRVNLGLVYLKSGQLPRAIREFERAVELAPDHAKAHNYLGLALAQAGEYGRAREAFLQAGSEVMAEKMARALAADRAPRPQTQAAPAALTLAASKTFVGMVAAAVPAVPEPPAAPAAPSARPYDAMLAQGLSANAPTAASRVPPPPPAPIPLVLEQRVTPPVSLPGDGPLGTAAAPAAYQGPGPSEAEPPVPPGAPLPGSAELSELAASLRLVGEGEASPFAVSEDSVLVTVRGELIVRTAGMIGFTGSLDFRPEFKRFRGRVTDRPFGEASERMQRVLGTGAAWVAREGRRFLAVSLGDEGAYLREPMVFGFEEQVNFENGRVPSDVAPDLDLVHLAGVGQVLLSLPGALRSLEVRADAPVTVPLEHWVGWQGQIAPRVLAMPWDHPRGGAAIAVELTGEGFALLCVGMG